MQDIEVGYIVEDRTSGFVKIHGRTEEWAIAYAKEVPKATAWRITSWWRNGEPWNQFEVYNKRTGKWEYR